LHSLPSASSATAAFIPEHRQSDFASESASKVAAAVDAAILDALNLPNDGVIPGDDEPLMAAGLTSLGRALASRHLKRK
jgi:hypothetical protein